MSLQPLFDLSKSLYEWEVAHPGKVLVRKAQEVLMGRIGKTEMDEEEKERISVLLLLWGFSWSSVKETLY